MTAAALALASILVIVGAARDVGARLAGVLLVLGALAAYVARRVELHRRPGLAASGR